MNDENNKPDDGLMNQKEEPASYADMTPQDSSRTPENEGIRRKSKVLVGRIILALLVIIIAAIAYVERHQLQKLFSSKANGEPAEKGKTDDRKILYWYDPMHPSYKSDKPGIAPDCGMDLVPMYEGGTMESNMPAGTINISPEEQQLIGVQTAVVGYQRLSRKLRNFGRITYDETKVTHVHTRVEGWIENVYVDYTGQSVKKGQKMLDIYSPELLQTQMEYLLAVKGRTQLRESSFSEISAGADSLYESARKRLELWDIDEKEIEQLEKTGKPTRTVPLYAPFNGTVLTRNAYPKQKVTADTDLYTLVDLSTIWVMADIFESDAADIKLGQQAAVTLAGYPGRTFRGRIAFINPQVDNSTRTLKARIELPNPGLLIKPDMYGNVEVNIDYGRNIVVPQEAVMDSGAEQQVFIALNGGYFEPRKIQLGQKVGNDYIVLSGLRAGERIVTSGNFLIDSESKLKSATSGMNMPGMEQPSGSLGQKGSSGTDHSDHQPGEQTSPTPAPMENPAHSMEMSQPVHEHDVKPIKKGDKMLYYTCTMHPEIRMPGPGKCPICKMNLIPKYADKK